MQVRAGATRDELPLRDSCSNLGPGTCHISGTVGTNGVLAKNANQARVSITLNKSSGTCARSSSVGLSLLLILAGGRYSHFLSVFRFIGGRAEVLAHLLSGTYRPSCRFAGPECRISFRIGERHPRLDRIVVHAPETFFKLHLIAMRVAVVVEPGFIVESDSKR